MKFCAYPLLVLNVTPTFVVPCCASYMDLSLMRELAIDSMECGSAWQSPKWADYRQRIASQDYSKCTQCALYANKDTEFYDEERLRSEYPSEADNILNMLSGNGDIPSPTEVILSFDPTCNLACPTCRGSVHKESDTSTMDRIVSNLSGILSTATRVVIAGDGELCVSKYYKDILANRTGNAKLTLMSNGTLLSRTFWEGLPQSVVSRIDQVNLSCDGTTQTVYERTRRNGIFTTFVSNVQYLHELRDKYNFRTKLMYTVSTQNADDYLNVPSFARRLGFDQIYIALATRWYRTFGNSTYASKSIIDNPIDRNRIQQRATLLNRLYKRN